MIDGTRTNSQYDVQFEMFDKYLEWKTENASPNYNELCVVPINIEYCIAA